MHDACKTWIEFKLVKFFGYKFTHNKFELSDDCKFFLLFPFDNFDISEYIDIDCQIAFT